MIRQKDPDRYNRFGLLGRLIEDISLLFLMINDFFRGRYRRVPIRSVAVLVFVFVYIFLPFDIVPDYLPVYGQIDDAIIAVFCLYLLEKDLHGYKKWKNENRRGG